MADLIQLLPDTIANQIAAGEVVQRPSSVVKELMENAVDAGATDIQLIHKGAGKELIQVVDNGCGMSATDARMAFERHATSKIRNTDDLFAIQTLGFRGEALASISAVAKVELRTRTHNEDLGTRIVIEDGKVIAQEPCQCPVGTNFMVQHLFYNVPARRKFLKSDSVEIRHMHEAFTHISLAHPEIKFRAFNNTNEVYHLESGKLSKRIIGLLGKHLRERIVPVEEETNHIRIKGFVSKPEFAKKRGGDQYFFVNGRYIKSRYLHHAVKMAYDKLLPDDGWPMYVIFIDLDATQIDINVHPTKQEIKFEDERLVYQYLRVAVRHALGQFTVAPMIDFESEAHLVSAPIGAPKNETVTTHILPSSAGGILNKFEQLNKGDRVSNYSSGTTPKKAAPGWGQLQKEIQRPDPQSRPQESPFKTDESFEIESSDWLDEVDDKSTSLQGGEKQPYQLHNSFIIHQLKSGYVLIDQQGAHERVLYERYLERLSHHDRQASQVELFPAKLSLNGDQKDALKSILPDLERLGFEIELAKDETHFLVIGLPADLSGQQDPQDLISSLLQQHKENLSLELNQRERIALTLARRSAVKRGTSLAPEAQALLVAQLFSTSHPEHTPSGQPCIVSYSLIDIERRFGR